MTIPTRFEWTRQLGIGPGIKILGPLTGRVVIEMGCGSGHNLAHPAAVHGSIAIGIDRDPVKITRARGLYGHVAGRGRRVRARTVSPRRSAPEMPAWSFAVQQRRTATRVVSARQSQTSVDRSAWICAGSEDVADGYGSEGWGFRVPPSTPSSKAD